MAAKAAAAAMSNGVTSNGKVPNGTTPDQHAAITNGGPKRREAADYYVKGDSITASELHLRKPAFAAAAGSD